MAKSSLRNPQGKNRVLLGEFKIQEDVKTYIQLTDYGDFQGFDLPNGFGQAAISEKIARDLRQLRGCLINII